MRARASDASSLRIGIDAHVVGREKGGAETYVVNLLRGLRDADTENAYTVFVAPAGASLAEWLPAPNLRFEVVEAEPLPVQRFIRLPARSRALGLDVLHVQRVAPPFLGAARVVTIHDVAHTVRPDLFDSREGLALRRLVRMSARMAERVVTDSQASRDDISRLFGVPDERIAVVPLGVEHAASGSYGSCADAVEGLGLRSPYVLCVGAIERRKNLPRLLEAFARHAASSTVSPTLVLAGPERTPGLSRSLTARAAELGLGERVVMTGYVDEATLGSLYRRARAFVFPSLFEGFGLPPLEALSLGLPVAASDLPVHREMLGDAATYFDPEDVDELAAALRTVVDDADARGRLSARGPARAAAFTWARTAELTLVAYREAANMTRSRGRWVS